MSFIYLASVVECLGGCDFISIARTEYKRVYRVVARVLEALRRMTRTSSQQLHLALWNIVGELED